MFTGVAVLAIGGCGGGSSYEVLAENPPSDSGEQEGIAGLQIEAEADSEAELLEVAQEVADDHEEDDTDGLVMSFQEPGERKQGWVSDTRHTPSRAGSASARWPSSPERRWTKAASPCSSAPSRDGAPTAGGGG